MKKNGKVTAIGYDGELSNAHGTFYKWKLQIDNGDSGTYLSKTNPQTKFVLGQLAHYDLNSEKGRIFYVNPDYEKGKSNKFNPERELRIVKQSCLATAVKYYDAMNEHQTPDGVIALAQMFTNFVMGKENEGQQSVKANAPQSIVDDAPF